MPEQPPLGPDPDAASDPAFDSLRDADPMSRADAVHSDDEAVRAHVRARLAEQAAPQRRRPWLAVAAAAAAAIVIGGGGYLVGAAVNNQPAQVADGFLMSTQSAPEAPGSILASAPAATPQQRDLASGGAAPELGTATGADSASKMSAVWSGRTVFTQQGLSTEVPADGQVSAVNPATPDPAVLTAVGAVVGISGEVQDTSSGDWKSWSIGSQDGTGPTAYLDGSGNLSVNDPAAWQNWNGCVDAGTPEPAIDPPADAPAADSSAAIDIMPVEPCTPSEPLPPLDQPAAEETIRSILTAAGLDAASYTITWGESTGDGQSWATVDPGWLPTPSADAARMGQWVPGSWNFNWVGNTFSGANGVIANLTDAGSYPLISAEQAVARLSDPRFGQPTMVAQPDTGAGAWQQPAVGSFTGGAIPWPVAEMTITGAELTDSALSLSNGVTLLAPTYRLSTADGYVWEVSALADSAYDFTS